ALHLDRARLDLHVADLPRGQALREAEAGLGPAGRAGQRVRHLRGGESVDLGDPAGGQLVAGVSVKAASGRIGIDDAAAGRIDEELDGVIALEDLAVEVVS